MKKMDRAILPFRSHFFSTPAGRMHYVDEGKGPPVVFLHGNPTSGFSFRRVILALRDRYRCLAPDLLGFGQSDKPPDAPYAPLDHANRVDQWLDHVTDRPATLLVQDWAAPSVWIGRRAGRIGSGRWSS